MEQFPGAQFFWEVHPVSAQNKNLISDTDSTTPPEAEPEAPSRSLSQG